MKSNKQIINYKNKESPPVEFSNQLPLNEKPIEKRARPN